MALPSLGCSEPDARTRRCRSAGSAARRLARGARGRWLRSAGRGRRRCSRRSARRAGCGSRCLLGVVADVGDVADRVVGVVQILQLAAWPAGRMARQSSGKACVRRCADGSGGKSAGRRSYVGPDAVAVFDQRALALGVVVDVGDEGVQPAGRPRAPRRLTSTRSSRFASL